MGLFGERKLVYMALGSVAAFTVINWVLMIQVQPVAPPDFYNYYQYTTSFSAFMQGIKILPPLYFLFLKAAGMLCDFCGFHTDCLILGGRLVSLLAGLGTLWATFLILRRISEKNALGVVTLSAFSPVFLYCLGYPLTDMIFLCWVMWAFWGFAEEKVFWSLLFCVLAVLTRYEGILLFACFFLAFFRKRYRLVRWTFLGLLLSSAAVCVYAGRLFPRLVNHCRNVLLGLDFIYFVRHPHTLLTTLKTSLLFWVPRTFPWFLKMLVLVFFLAGFVYFIKQLWHRNRRLCVALLLYMVLFALSKGYVSHVGSQVIHTRRLLSLIYLFWILSIAGVLFFMRLLVKRVEQTGLHGLAALLFVIAAAVLAVYLKYWALAWAGLFVLPVAFVIGRGNGSSRVRKACAVLCVIGIAWIYPRSVKMVNQKNMAIVPAGALAAAQYIRHRPQLNIRHTLFLVNRHALNYYAGTKGPFTDVADQPFCIKKDSEQYWDDFFAFLRLRRIKYIVVDSYLRFYQDPDLRSLKFMIVKNRNRQDLFRVQRVLRWQGRPAAWVLAVTGSDKQRR